MIQRTVLVISLAILVAGTAGLAFALAAPAAAPKADPCACPQPFNFIQVPQAGKRYVGPTALEGEIMNAAGRKYAVTVLVDGVARKVSLSVLNPGAKEMVMWRTAPLKEAELPDGPHVAIITVVDLATPSCPRVDVISFATKQ